MDDDFDNPAYYSRLRQMYANSIPANEGAGDLIYGGRRKKKASAWNMHVKRYAKAHPNVPFEDIAYKARASYKGSGTTAGGRRRSVKRRSTSMKRRSTERRAGFFGPLLGAIASVGLPHLAKAIGLGSRAGAFVGGKRRRSTSGISAYRAPRTKSLAQLNREQKDYLRFQELGLEQALPVSLSGLTVDELDSKTGNLRPLKDIAKDYRAELDIIQGREMQKKLKRRQFDESTARNKAIAKYAKVLAKRASNAELANIIEDKRVATKTILDAEMKKFGVKAPGIRDQARTALFNTVGTGYSSFYDGLLGSGRRKTRKRKSKKPSMATMRRLLGMGFSGGASRKKKRPRY